MTITALHVNTQSIHLKLPSIQNLIHIHNPDFISIQETFLKLNQHPKTTIPGYKVKDFRRQNQARGGIILAYIESIKHSKTEKITTNKKNEYIKSTFFLNDLPLTVISFYNPKDTYIDTLEIDNLLTDTSILFGDLNCRHPCWGDSTSNGGGTKLFNLITRNNINCTYHTQPTHTHQAPPYTKSTIDICLWRTKHKYIKNVTPTNLDDISSDHLPVFFKIESNLNKPKSTKHIPLYHQYNWESANERILNIDTNDLTIEGIDRTIDTLEQITSEIIENIPMKTIYTSNQGLSKEIRNKISEKKTLTKTWNRYHNPADKRQLNRLSKEIKKNDQRF